MLPRFFYLTLGASLFMYEQLAQAKQPLSGTENELMLQLRTQMLQDDPPAQGRSPFPIGELAMGGGSSSKTVRIPGFSPGASTKIQVPRGNNALSNTQLLLGLRCPG